MTTMETIGAEDLRSVILAYRDVLRAHQQVINRLNVFPVPDGDTGTNMALTLESVTAELAGLTDAGDPDMATTCKAIAHGSLMGARGNSGVILSQLLRGIVEEFDACGGPPGPVDLARALATADRLARDAVMRPVEGTILTVARGAADGARDAAEAGRSLLDVLEASRSGAAEALASTPALLPVLARAGVVDAGGSGYALLFDAFLSVVEGRPLPAAPDVADVADVADGSDPGGPGLPDPTADLHALGGAAGGHGGETALADLRYEVMYLLEADDETIPAFKEVWAGIGDSIVVVGGNGLWNCHIHTDDIGAAVEASLDAGRPRNIRVTDLMEEVEEERWVRVGAESVGSGPSDTPPGPPPATGVVAVATGVGIGRIFRSLGVHHLIAGGQSMNPSTAEILEAIEELGSDDVVVLPNNKNIRPVAERVGELTTKRIRVIPTDTIAEGFAALLAYDPAADADVNAEAMEASARRVVAGEVTQAVRDTDSDVGPISVGDWLGLSRRGIEVVDATLVGGATGLLGVLVTDDHELVTLIEGEGATAADTRRITEWLHEHRPGVDVEVHSGGQPLYPYLFSIE